MKHAVPATAVREVRMALVLNGGVSLAVWIGGVTNEIDAGRRAGPDEDGTAALYGRLFKILRETVRVDVIAGASAGGINGALLGAAIAAGKPLDSLRDTWMGDGDMATLLRPASLGDPPSLLQGNEILLPAVRERLEAALGKGATATHPLYLYVTATNLYGRPAHYRDSTGRTFDELDSRHIFSFESIPGADVRFKPSAGARRRGNEGGGPQWPVREAGPTSFADPAIVCRLAEAARASSSFPGAFEAAGPLGDQYFIDGGVLDNQPFGPVLDRIGILPAAGVPVKRVVGYVVPYVNEPGSEPAPRLPPSALDTVTASSKLPRNLPKLQSLDRVTAEQEAERADDAQRRTVQRLLEDSTLRDQIRQAADALFTAYCHTRRQATRDTYERWSASDFVPGAGVAGQDATIAVSAMAAPTADGGRGADASGSRLWIPRSSEWRRTNPTWTWGLSPAERVASWALLVVREKVACDPANPDLERARDRASQLVWDVRTLKQHLSENFATPLGRRNGTPERRAHNAYGELRAPTESKAYTGLQWLQAAFVSLDEDLERAEMPRVSVLLNVEVARNALRIDTVAAPCPFDFVFMSAGIANSLGHRSDAPEQKLAGMKLGHFGGFLKRSWRANDWLWGRLDGVEHLTRSTFEIQHLRALVWSEDAGDLDADDEQIVALAKKLCEFALDGDEATSKQLRRRWEDIVRGLRRPALTTQAAEKFATRLAAADANEQFRLLLHTAIVELDESCLDACRAALAARIQLQVLTEELPIIEQAVDDDLAGGSSSTANGARWARRWALATAADDVSRFQDMTIGEESLADELTSRSGIDVAAHGIAVATAALTGARGGLPVAARALLTGLRAFSLALSYLARLLARSPSMGTLVIVALGVLTYLAGKSDGSRLGTLAPTLAGLSVAAAGALLVIATGAVSDPRSKVKQGVALTLVVVLPLLLGLAGIDPLAFGTRGWVTERVGFVATNVATGAAFVAAAAAAVAAAMLSSRSSSRMGFTRWLINGYRLVVLFGTAAIAAGVVLDRYRTVCVPPSPGCSRLDFKRIADEQTAILIAGLLLAMMVVAALIVEIGAFVRHSRAKCAAPE